MLATTLSMQSQHCEKSRIVSMQSPKPLEYNQPWCDIKSFLQANQQKFEGVQTG